MEALLGQGKKELSVLSVLGFCYFNTGEYLGAITCYEELIKIKSDKQLDYRHHLAQSLFKAGKMEEALEVCEQVLKEAPTPEMQNQAVELKAAILYEKNEFQMAISTIRSLKEKEGVN